MNKIPKFSKDYIRKDFLTFSVIFFLIISLITITAYSISSHKINLSYVEQQLTLASETTRLRLATTVNSELALVRKMADTPVIRQYFKDPSNRELEALARDEFNIFIQHFELKIVFWINDVDKIFYISNSEPYTIDPNDPESYWYNLTLYSTEKYNFNINYNPNVEQIYLWVNAPVFEEIDNRKKPLGMLGTGINLTNFINFISNAHMEYDSNITPYTFNRFYEITSAANYDLVYNKTRLNIYLGEIGDEIIRTARLLSDGERRIFINNDKMYLVSSIPEMEWFLTLSYPLPGFIALNQSINIVFFSMLFLIFITLVTINIFIARSENAITKQNIQLLEANEKAEAASRTKSRFLATMSHEIRTPLNAIIGIAQIEMQNEKLSEKHKIAFKQIQRSGNNLLGIINDILDMSKIETGKLELNPVVYDVPSLINDAVQLNIVRIGSKPIVFKLDVKESLPSKLYGDELRIKQILNNLLSNAIKYTEKGEVILSVRYIFADENIMLKFIIKDTGQGMKPEDKDRLFSEYMRFNKKSNRFTEGTGLGLNITKKIVEMMDGTISVESEYGKGSTFTVSIWQRTDEYIPIGEELAQRLSNFTFTSIKQDVLKITHEEMPYGSVLVVDDVDTNLYVAHGILSFYNLEIDLADSGYAAIKKLEEGNNYDVIFMDQMMPRMDGIETTQKLRSGGYTGTIIALTANALAGNDEMFIRKGFDGFIPKPIDLGQLNVILNKFVRDKHPEEAKKYKPEITVMTQEEMQKRDLKLKQAFCHNAKKAIVTMREAVQQAENDDSVNLFTATVHSMKSALSKISEFEVSQDAYALESAGKRNDIEFINANLESFIKILETLIEEFTPVEDDET